jgi:hypothetical protein
MSSSGQAVEGCAERDALLEQVKERKEAYRVLADAMIAVTRSAGKAEFRAASERAWQAQEEASLAWEAYREHVGRHGCEGAAAVVTKTAGTVAQSL